MSRHFTLDNPKWAKSKEKHTAGYIGPGKVDSNHTGHLSRTKWKFGLWPERTSLFDKIIYFLQQDVIVNYVSSSVSRSWIAVEEGC